MALKNNQISINHYKYTAYSCTDTYPRPNIMFRLNYHGRVGSIFWSLTSQYFLVDYEESDNTRHLISFSMCWNKISWSYGANPSFYLFYNWSHSLPYTLMKEFVNFQIKLNFFKKLHPLPSNTFRNQYVVWLRFGVRTFVRCSLMYLPYFRYPRGVISTCMLCGKDGKKSK